MGYEVHTPAERACSARARCSDGQAAATAAMAVAIVALMLLVPVWTPRAASALEPASAAGSPDARAEWGRIAGASAEVAAGTSATLAEVTAGTPATLAEVRELGSACLRAPSERFPDVFSVHQRGVDCIGWWGVTAGDADGRYEPRRPVRREQMASFIDRTLDLTGIEEPATPAGVFADLTGGVHDEAIARLTTLEVVGGVAADRFDPVGTVNRAQMASFLARAYEARTGEELPVDDDATFSDIAGNVHADNIVRIATAGLTGGVDGDRFDPAGTVTRAQMGTFLARFLALLVDEGLLAPTPTDPVPHPDDPSNPDHDPFARTQGQPITPVPGDALPGADGAGPIAVPATAPVILSSLPVDLRPGEERRFRVALPSPLANVSYWLHDGPATASFADGACPEPGGRGIGIASGITTTYGDAFLSVRHEPDRDGCLQGSAGDYRFSRIHGGDVIEIVLDNAGSQRFESRLHVAQAATFTPIAHPAGTRASYLYDSTGLAPDIPGLSGNHPLGLWFTQFQTEEASTITLVQDPFTVAGTEFCHTEGRLIPVESLDENVDEGGLTLPELNDAPGRCEMRLETDGAVRIVMNVGADDRLLIEVEPRG